MGSNSFIRITLIEEEVDEITAHYHAPVPVVGVDFDSNREAFINKSHVHYFTIDQKERRINLVFSSVSADYLCALTLEFRANTGEFERIKRELMN